MSKVAAFETIATARERADLVKSLLQELGDSEETLSLAARFRRTTRRLEQCSLDAATAGLFGRLTLAVHDLNCLVQEAFYSGPAATQPVAVANE
jgi:hypothetical protein